MRKLLTILFAFIGLASLAQPVVNRAGKANTVVDQRLDLALNLGIPIYPDTTTANISTNLGLDSVGRFIFTRDVNNFWIRVDGPKHWQQGSGGGTVLPDGVYSGGQVAWSGVGYDYIVSAATYVLGGVIYNSPQTTISLPTADPTFNRIDVIGLSFSGAAGVAISVTGVPAANPFEPSTNPQIFIRRSIVNVIANTTQPPYIDQTIIYDEGNGEPGEWTPSSTGTTNFVDQSTPYHLVRDAMTTAINSTQRILFINDDTVQSASRSSLVLFINFQTVLPAADNINVQLRLNGVPVSVLLPITKYGPLRNINLSYQMAAIPFSEFSPSNIIFDEIDLVPTGASPFPIFYTDYIQIQTGLSQIVQIPDYRFAVPTGDNFANGNRDFNLNSFGFNYNNTAQFKIHSTTSPLSDSLFLVKFAGNDLIRVSNIDNITHLYQLQVANLSASPLNTSAGMTGGRFYFQGGAYLASYQQELSYIKQYPNLGPDPADPMGLMLRNDTLSGGTIPPTDSIAYKPLAVLWTNHNGVENRKFYVRGDGAIWSKSTPHASTNVDSILIKENGYIAYRTLAELGITGSSGTVTSIGFNTGTGITSTAVPLTTTGTVGIDTTIISTKAFAQSLLTTYFNSNVGSSYRWVIPNTNQAKTLRVLNGILADSATSNTLSIQIDSSQYATKAYVQSVAGGGGFTGVTSVSVASANGFAGSVANPTTTPAITLSTTITGLLKGNGTAISAAVAGTDYLAPNGSAAALTSFPTLNQNTTGTSSNVTGTVLVTNGGTGRTTNTAYALMAAGTTSTGNMQQVSGVGTSGQVLTSNGAATLPTWQTPVVTSGVASITGTANQVNASASTGAVTLSLPQSIATTSTPTFRSLTLGGTAATTPLTFTTNTDATASAGRWYYNTTRLGFSLAATILRVPLTNDVAPTVGQGIFGNGATYTVGTYSALNNSVLVAPSAAGVTFRTNSIVQTLSGTSVTLNANSGENAVWTLTASGSSLAITNPVAGRMYFFNVVQDATGSRTITTYPTGTVWYSGSAPTLKTGAGNVNTLAFYYNGSNYYGYDWGSGGGGGGFVNPMTTLGDMIIGAGAGAAARLAGNITTAPMVLTSTGTGAAATSQTWQPTFTGRTTSATLDFPSTAAQSSSEMTIAVTGAVVGDVVEVGTGVSNTNSSWSARVASAGFVAIRFNNYSTIAQNPVPGTFKVIVWQ